MTSDVTSIARFRVTERRFCDGAVTPAALPARNQSAETQARYDAFMQEAIARQIFAAPTYVYKNELFRGQDRLDFFDRALAQ
jgi:2-hydroxychromene-2-carboxylate isomerase